MKYLLILLCWFYFGDVFAHVVCGVALPVTPEISYGTINYNQKIGVVNWAVGTGCAGAVDNEIPVNEMCDKVYVAGRAGVGTSTWVSGTDESKFTGLGAWCNCRRIYVTIDGVLTESPGPWVLVTDRNVPCPQICAKTVAFNHNGLRNPIMLLPAE